MLLKWWQPEWIKHFQIQPEGMEDELVDSYFQPYQFNMK